MICGISILKEMTFEMGKVRFNNCWSLHNQKNNAENLNYNVVFLIILTIIVRYILLANDVKGLFGFLKNRIKLVRMRFYCYY